MLFFLLCADEQLQKIYFPGIIKDNISIISEFRELICLYFIVGFKNLESIPLHRLFIKG